MSEKEKVEFIPFHAINEFMRNDFRLQVIRSVLGSLQDFDPEITSQINRLTRKYVKVAGFRNSAKAPATVKAVAMVKVFEKQPDLVAAILRAWAVARAGLRQNIYHLLLDRGWKLLPMEANRENLPGFLTQWPSEDDYDTLYDALLKNHPEMENSIDEVSLMVVYLSNRLPIHKISMDELIEIEGFESKSSRQDENIE
jgi:hypothetical protein